jgi:hypothetical protein
MKAKIDEQLRLNRRIAAQWAQGFAIAAGIWTLLAGAYLLSWEDGSGVGMSFAEVFEVWVPIAAPLIGLAVFLLALSCWPGSRNR